MNVITAELTMAQFVERFPNAKPFELPSIERPMVEVHLESGQMYPRTRANFERTRRMAAKLGPATARKLERDYAVYELVQS